MSAKENRNLILLSSKTEREADDQKRTEETAHCHTYHITKGLKSMIVSKIR
ncbi:MAG: hypothetical protein H3Z50_01955 [archaeon]|nr:hypothetical protein [archaeon]